MRSVFLLLLVFAASDVSALFGRTQSAGVHGILMCNDKPASNVKVKLYDEDSGPDLDDLMASGETDSQGHFELKGYTDELTSIDPKINVYHDCDDGNTPCQRRITIYIPKKYVSRGKVPKELYNAGSIQLAGKFSGETRDCFNLGK